MNEGTHKRGPHPSKALTAARIRSLTEPGRYADGDGLYLLITPGGARSWVLRLVSKREDTTKGGKPAPKVRRDIGLGSLRDVTLAEAREEAHRYRKVAKAGGDPLAERRKQSHKAPTFEDAARLVHASHAETFRNPKHRAQWLSSLSRDVFPVIGSKPVDQVTSGDLLNALNPIWLVKPETARRIAQRIRVVFDWAKAAGHRPGDNPVAGLSRALPKHRATKAHHAALPYAQVPAFIRDLRATDAGEATRLAFELLILTACRTSEVVGARWAEIDLDAATWTIPANRIKAGREHRVPLSPRAVQILERAKALSDGGPFVFPGHAPDRPLSNMVFLMLLRRMDRRDMTPHGFRSSFRDWAAERTHMPREVCEAALAHTLKDKTEAAYNRTDLFERRRDLMRARSAYACTLQADVIAFRA